MHSENDDKLFKQIDEILCIYRLARYKLPKIVCDKFYLRYRPFVVLIFDLGSFIFAESGERCQDFFEMASFTEQ